MIINYDTTPGNLFSGRELPEDIYNDSVNLADQSEQKPHLYLIKGRKDRPNPSSMDKITRLLLSIIYS